MRRSFLLQSKESCSENSGNGGAAISDQNYLNQSVSSRQKQEESQEFQSQLLRR